MELANASAEVCHSRSAWAPPAADKVIRMSEFCAPAALPGIRELRRHVYQQGEMLGAPRQVLDLFNTALSELASNALQHPRPPASHFRLAMELGKQGLTATLRTDADSFADREELYRNARPWSHMHSEAKSGRGLYIALCLFPFMDYSPRRSRPDGYECYTLNWKLERESSPG